MRFFHLEVDSAGGDGYRATARSPVAGEATGRFRLPWRDGELDGTVRRVEESVIQSSAPATRHLLTDDEQVVQRFGSALFAMLPTGVRELLRTALESAEAEGWPLAVALLARPPELVRLPWEFLYLPERREFPFLRVPLVRCLALSGPRRPWRTELPLRMLAMIGHPDGLDPDEEQQRLAKALDGLVRDDQVRLTWVSGRRWTDLFDSVRFGPRWNVLHVLGHGRFDQGRDEGDILVEDEEGRPYHLPAHRLAVWLRGRPSLRLVVLNACHTGRTGARDPYSSIAASLVYGGIPAVVAMQFRITDPAAIAFSESFYGAVARRTSIMESVTGARQYLQSALADTLEWGTPVLYVPWPESEAFAISGNVRWDPKRVATIRSARDVNDVAFSPDNAQLALACDGRRSLLVDTASWTGPPPDRRWGAHLYAVAFSPDGAWLATGGRDGTVRIWDLGTGTMALPPLHHPDWVSAVAFSADGLFATACGDGVVRLWDLRPERSRADVRAQLAHPAAVRAVAFHPRGDRVATASDDRRARVWTTDGDRLASLPHAAAVFGVAYSPDGQRLATGCQDSVARVWDVDARRCEREMRHDGWVLSVAYSPDGLRLATASRDRTARVWEVANGNQSVVIRHSGTVRRVAVSPDGRWLATASYDNTAQVWQFAREVTGQDG